MNKREMLHTLIDRLLDIEDSSKKGVNFSYSTSHGADFYFNVRPETYAEWIGGRTSCYLKKDWDAEAQFSSALTAIELMKNTPDQEPKVSITLTQEKARELGLIA